MGHALAIGSLCTYIFLFLGYISGIHTSSSVLVFLYIIRFRLPPGNKLPPPRAAENRDVIGSNVSVEGGPAPAIQRCLFC